MGGKEDLSVVVRFSDDGRTGHFVLDDALPTRYDGLMPITPRPRYRLLPNDVESDNRYDCADCLAVEDWMLISLEGPNGEIDEVICWNCSIERHRQGG